MKGGVTMDFIIKKQKSSNRTIRMPDDLYERMSKIAFEEDISFNQLVVQCCEFALDHLKGNGGAKNDDTE